MGTTLTGTTPQDTYDSLIKVTDNGPLSGTAKYLSDGLGNDSALALSTSAVGVGLNNPSRALHVKSGTGTAQIESTTSSSTLYFADSTTTTIDNQGVGSAGNGITILTGGLERLRVDSSGNVGIGTDAPDTKLRVKGIGSFIDADLTETGIRVGANENYYWQFSRENINFGHLSVYEKDNTTPVERLRFTQTSAGSYFRLMSGTGGIQFNGDTAAANALSDYEQGEWTMGIAFGGASVGVTYSANTGTYTKIGRQVTVNGYLTLSNKGSSTGTARITGLPFTIGNGSQFYTAASVSELENVTFADVYYAWGNINSTNIILKEVTTAGVSSALTDANFANNSGLMVSLTYFV